jgi:hypothetical protein
MESGEAESVKQDPDRVSHVEGERAELSELSSGESVPMMAEGGRLTRPGS